MRGAAIWHSPLSSPSALVSVLTLHTSTAQYAMPPSPWCAAVWVQHVQHGNAERKCSTGGQAQVHAREGVGELGAVVVVMCGATAVDSRGVSAGRGARAMCSHTPLTSDIVPAIKVFLCNAVYSCVIHSELSNRTEKLSGVVRTACTDPKSRRSRLGGAFAFALGAE